MDQNTYSSTGNRYSFRKTREFGELSAISTWRIVARLDPPVVTRTGEGARFLLGGAWPNRRLERGQQDDEVGLAIDASLIEDALEVSLQRVL